MKAPEPKEIVLHIALAGFLRDYIATGWLFTHPASGEHRDKRTAGKLKAMGLAPGWPDLVLVSPEGKFHGLELKRKGDGSLNVNQREFQAHCDVYGWPYEVVDDLQDAIEILRGWGALRVAVV